MTVQITADNFQTEVLNSEEPVLLDFYANWCMPCKMLSPVIEELSSELTDAKVGKVNVDEEPELAEKFRVMSIPTLVALKDGKVLSQTQGVRPKEEIRSMLLG